MKYTITHNDEYDSNEVYFEDKPDAGTREALKALKMRWHSVKKCWYGKASTEQINAACTGGTVEAKPESKPAGNKYGVKVGDLFYMSWGWEQTNIDMFQVVELVGASSVRVRQVSPRVAYEFGISDMSRDVAYKLPENGELLPASHGIFVKDDERGDLHRLIADYSGDGCHIKFDNRYNAYPYYGGKLYESWYA